MFLRFAADRLKFITSLLRLVSHGGLCSLFLCASLGPALATSPVFLNPGFETPNLGNGGSLYNPTGAAWTFDAHSGITNNNSGFTSGGPNAPEGNQVALVYLTGAFSQAIIMPAGTYSISFFAAQRIGSHQDFEVLVDGVSVGTVTPASTTYATYDTYCFSVSDGSHTVQFQGLNTHVGDNTAFIDAVNITPHDGSTAPPVPVGLTTASANAQITLMWPPACTATSYNIYRSATSNGEGTTPYRTGIIGTSFTDSGLTNGITYYYKVSAVNSVGASALSIETSAIPMPAFLNPGFETPNLGNGGSQYNPTGAAWTFDAHSGITNNNSGFTSGGPNAPEGNQVALVYLTGAFSQAITMPAGTYSISFFAAQRIGSHQDFEVLVDGISVGTVTPPSTAYATYTTSYFTVTSGSHTVQFKGLNTDSGDNTAFIDAISVKVFIPVLTSITVSPSSATIHAGGIQQFTASGKDQNGNPMPSQPTVTWTVSGGGAINSTGIFTAGGAVGGPFTVTAASGSVSGTASVTVTPGSSIDFNGDGKADLVLQNTGSRQVALWYMNGLALLGGQVVSSTPPAGWSVVAEGDFNGDGKPDLALQDSATNKVALWYLSGPTLTGGAYISATPAANWKVAGSGDFNGDGKPDLVLQNAATNQVAVWYLNGTTVIGGGYISTTPPSGWRVAATGDFNSDGKPDLMLQNAATNQVAIWYLNGLTVTGGAFVSSTPPSGWNVVGAGDFNGDGKRDLVLQNTATSQIALWYLNGVSLTGGGYVSTTPAGWKVAGPR